MEVWFARALLYFILFVIISVGILIYGNHPKTEIVKGGKLALPEFSNAKQRVELVARMFFVILGITLFLMLVFPLGKDVVFLSKGGIPLSISGKVTYVSSPFGMWFLKQTVMFDGEKNTADKSYMMMLSGVNLRMDDSFSVMIIPNSQMIVSAKLIP